MDIAAWLLVVLMMDASYDVLRNELITRAPIARPKGLAKGSVQVVAVDSVRNDGEAAALKVGTEAAAAPSLSRVKASTRSAAPVERAIVSAPVEFSSVPKEKAEDRRWGITSNSGLVQVEQRVEENGSCRLTIQQNSQPILEMAKCLATKDDVRYVSDV